LLDNSTLIREETADANSRDGAGIIILDGGGRAHKIEWHARIDAEVARKVYPRAEPKSYTPPSPL